LEHVFAIRQLYGCVMADVLPFVRETQVGGVEPSIGPVVTSTAPRSNVSPSEIASPYQMLGHMLDQRGENIARAADKASGALEAVAEPLAERAGLQAVTTDANGNIKVDKVPIFGEAGKTYARAIKFAAVSEGEGAAKREDIALREKYRDNPQGYLAAAGTFKNAKVKEYTDAAGPEVGITLGKLIDSQTTLTYRGLLNEKERLDLQRAESSIRAGIESAKDSLTALANQGVTDGPEWNKYSGQMKALYGEMANNPRLGVSKDMINYEMDKFHSELQVQGIRYHANQIYEQDGPNAAVDFGKSILTDPSLKLNDVQRRAAFETVRSEIHMNEAERRQTVKDVADDFRLVKETGDATPATIADLHKRAMDAKDPLLAAAVSQYGTMRAVIGPFNKLPLPEQQRYIDGLEARVEGGTATGNEAAIAKELKAAKAQTETALKDEGWGLVQRRFPDKIEMPPALDAGNPQQFAAGVAARAKIAKLGEDVFQGGPVRVLGKDEVGTLRSALAGQNGPAVLTAVGQAVKGEDMQALLAEKGVRDSIEGMARSGDTAKMTAAYSFLDQQQKANPLQFDQQFKDGLKNLRAWQSNLAFYPPDEAAKRMMRSYDPDQSAAHQSAIKLADEQLKSVTADKIVSKFSTGFGPFGTTARAPVSDQVAVASGALKADYDQNYREGFTATGNPTAADVFAMEKLQLKYAVSAVNGNRLMPYAPERYYPAIGGSQDWMAKQLDDAVKEATGATVASPGAEPAPARQSPEQAAARARRAALETPGNREYRAPRALVADDQTERDISNGRPPSYQVMVQDGNGRWSVMTAPGGGAVGRFRFDPAPLLAARAAELSDRRQSLEGFSRAIDVQAPF